MGLWLDENGELWLDENGELCDALVVHLCDDNKEVLIAEAITDVGIGVEHLDCPTAHRGVLAGEVLGLHEIDLLEEIVDIHIAGDLVGILAGGNALGNDNVGIVPDITYNLLKNILHCYDTESTAELVNYHS